MDAISQTTFSNAFSWMKMLEYRLKSSLKFVPQGPINNIPALLQIMAWHRPGDKLLSAPMMVRLPTHICVTRPQWVKIDSKNESHNYFDKVLLPISLVLSIGQCINQLAKLLLPLLRLIWRQPIESIKVINLCINCLFKHQQLYNNTL